jgi:glutamyl-Q tRNA(Asp) synthetase
MPFVTRFAPSPTGLLHLGHAFAACTVLDAAAASGGKALLRIDDLDTTRCRFEFERSLIDECEWLGFDTNEPLLRQSQRGGAYEAALETLAAKRLVYPCFMSRAQIRQSIASAPHEGEPVYVREGPVISDEDLMARLVAGEAPVWRLDSRLAQDILPYGATFLEEGSGDDIKPGEHAIDMSKLGDVILSRRDVPASYHLATVVDDAEQGVTHVIRGADLHSSAHLQAALCLFLALPVPVYRHHRLIRDEGGKRLAKRHDALALKRLRDQGMSLDGVRALWGSTT